MAFVVLNTAVLCVLH